MDPILLIFLVCCALISAIVIKVESWHVKHRLAVPGWVYYFAGIAIALFIAALWVLFMVAYDPYPVAMLHHVR